MYTCISAFVSSLFHINVFKTSNEAYDRLCFIYGVFTINLKNVLLFCKPPSWTWTVSISQKIFCTHMDLFVHWKTEILRFLENGWKYIQYSNYGFILWMFLLLSAMLKIHYVREKEFDADSESQSRLSVCLDAALLWYAYFMQSYTWMHAMLLYL